MSDKEHNAIPGGGGFHKSSAYLTKSDDGYKRHGQHVDVALHGEGLLGESLAPKRQGNMAEKFIVPPFSVLSARNSWWQDRKRAWLALGIKSELGRGGELTWQGDVAHDRTVTHDKAAPGGSMMPAMDYRNRERDNSTGAAVAGTQAAPLTLQAPERPGATTVAPAAVPAVQRAPSVAQTAVALVAPAAPRFAAAPAPKLYSQAPAPVAVSGGVPKTVIGYDDPFLAAHAAELTAAGGGPLKFDADTWDHETRSAVGFDVEVFSNFFVLCFRRFSDGKRLAFERTQEHELDVATINRVMTKNVIISFNGNMYDLPIIALALGGADNAKLKAASDKIVFWNLKPWEVEKTLGVRVPRYNHVDLIEPNPSIRQGLKMIHGRLHGRYMVDLPFPPEAVLTPQQMNVTTLYCFNDIDATEMLYHALREPLELRVALGKTYGMDFRSKSDAQIGETIVKSRVEIATKRRIERGATIDLIFRYDVPEFIRFTSDNLRRILEDLRETDFQVVGGKVAAPSLLQNLQIPIGEMTYSMGIGGLHSTEAHRAVLADEEHDLLDVDVTGHYPNIIMKLGLYPKAFGSIFLDIYGQIIRDRAAAKAAGNKVKADSEKIVTNGIFGKLGSSYSPLYAPNLLVAVTLTGQLTVLMLIERAEAEGIPVVSANTDGVVFRCPKEKASILDDIITDWEETTGFTIERTPYRALYSASVNTYVAVKEDGKTKRKGYIADPWSEGDIRGQISKNPQMTVCSEAIVRYLVDGITFNDTIRNCRDPRMFVTVIKVTGGAVWRSAKLGRTVRWYWSTDGEQINYADGSKKVSKTEGARPLPEMTDQLPPDVNHARYIEEAIKIAIDLGIPGFKETILP